MIGALSREDMPGETASRTRKGARSAREIKAFIPESPEIYRKYR